MNRYKVSVKDTLGSECVGDIELEKIEDIENVAILKSSDLTCDQVEKVREELQKNIGKEVLIINSPYDIAFLEIEKIGD